MELRMLITILVSGAIIAFLWYLRGLMLTPVIKAEDQKLVAVLTVSGHMPELSHTVEALSFIINTNALPMEVIIADAGMNDETKLMAELLSISKAGVWLCNVDDIPSMIKADLEFAREVK